VLAEQHDEWTEGRRYMGLELLTKSRIRIVTTEPDPTDEPASNPDRDNRGSRRITIARSRGGDLVHHLRGRGPPEACDPHEFARKRR
jgi:hypothetical protein